MNLKEVKEFVALAKSEGLADFSLEGKDYKLSFSFVSSANMVTQSYTPVSNSIVAPIAVEPTKSDVSISADVITVKSPFVGTFYGSPAPGKPAYVKVGDKVKVGQPLCILEAMKIMNEIDAEVSGEIVEICIENESLVEYGQALFKIKKK